MKIGLIDVDGHNFPNIPLMKISSYYKKLGNSVEWYEPMFSGHMDTVYMSKVFGFTDDYPYHIDADLVIRGGHRLRDHVKRWAGSIRQYKRPPVAKHHRTHNAGLLVVWNNRHGIWVSNKRMSTGLFVLPCESQRRLAHIQARGFIRVLGWSEKYCSVRPEYTCLQRMARPVRPVARFQSMGGLQPRIGYSFDDK